MPLTYFKRYRMYIDLEQQALAEPVLPEGYQFYAWDVALLAAHATAKYRSFCTEIDAVVFPCLGDPAGCLRLMTEISRKATFLPAATWLLGYVGDGRPTADFCGTIQGIRDENEGAIQNIGVVPEHRGRGLGTQLILRALHGFRQAGLRRVYLEVTAQNEAAIRLYRRIGFETARTVYKAAPLVSV
jgi:ribosomal protein S18 acetylase RimI-like enzyme